MNREVLDELIGRAMADRPGLSDLLFSPGKPVQAAVDGILEDIASRSAVSFSPAAGRDLATTLLGDSARLWKDLTDKGYCDLAYQTKAGDRFRVNVYTARGGVSVAMRRLPRRIPSMEELGLPPVFRDIGREPAGLVLVTGGTGTGKTTSLATVIDDINSREALHIITLEDPVEFMHPHRRAVVSQRELGLDFMAFADGLKAALRQTPRVIMVGELRDRETMEVALQASETGHLVLGSLHAPDACGTIQRILGFFEPKEERQIRGRLAESLKFCVSQRLMQRAGGGRAAAFEVLRTGLRTREILRDGETETKTLQAVMQAGGAYGMITFDDSLAELYRAGHITEESAMGAATDRFHLHRVIDRVKTGRGERTTQIGNLSLDEVCL